MDGGEKIVIRIRGVRGSYPVPGQRTLRFGGNTTCHEVQAGGRVFIFDAGTGIISLGDEIMRARRQGSASLDLNLFLT
ncbi:MAG: MBL fold metallo-hydrolase, partial [Planctomycetota bacterium]|nr:MBL fold metallo-hydrolase [Planctomycetota bacterium]